MDIEDKKKMKSGSKGKMSNKPANGSKMASNGYGTGYAKNSTESDIKDATNTKTLSSEEAVAKMAANPGPGRYTATKAAPNPNQGKSTTMKPLDPSTWESDAQREFTRQLSAPNKVGAAGGNGNKKSSGGQEFAQPGKGRNTI